MVRRATRVSRLVSIGGTLLLILWISMEVGRSPRFLFLWIALVIITYFVLFTLSRRVAFEVIRGRGVPVAGEGEPE